MTADLKTRILHDLKRIAEAIRTLISDLDEVPEVKTKGEDDGESTSDI